MLSFSIVVPTYNGAAYIEQTLLSALSQTRPANEIIVSDDNSTDETLAICKKFTGKIKIFSNPQGPSGFVNGWNNAISKATGDFISILHQDDVLAPDFLKEADAALQIHPDIKHLFVPCNYIDSEGNSLCEPEYCTGEIKRYTGREYVNAYQTIGHPHIHRCPGVVTHRDIFKVCQYREEAGHIADDDFFYRVGQYTDVAGVLKPLASFRLHQKSETGHLEYKKLIERLSCDYIYQIKQWRNSSFLPGELYEYFVKWAKYYISEEMYYSIATLDKELFGTTLKNIKELHALGIGMCGTFFSRLYNKIKRSQ